MTLSIGMTVMNGSGRRGPSAPPPVFALTLAELSRDRAVFDSGAAIGARTAEVPLAGTGTAGQVVQARALSLDDGGDGTSGWSDVAQIGPDGSWAGTLTAPLLESWYRAEVRLKAVPGITASAANRFGAGHVMALWGQSEVARMWDPFFSQTTPPALPTMRTCVERLKTDAATNGRQSHAPLKLPGTDILPAGVSWTAPSVTVTISQAVVLENWDFTGFRLVNAETASGTVIRNCRFGQTQATAGLLGYLECEPGGQIALVEYCDFAGYAGDAGAGYAIKSQIAGSGASITTGQIERISRCRFTALSSDAIKMTGGRVEWCYFGWSRNLDRVPAPWSASVTYAAGDYAHNPSGHVFRSLANGNLGNPVPSVKSDTAFWQNIDPHVDAITIYASAGHPKVAFCQFDMPQDLAAGLIGINNAVRIVRNGSGSGQDARFDRATVEHCIMLRASNETSRAIEVSSGGLPNWSGPVTIRHNWIGGGQSGAYLGGLGNGEWVIWTGNRDAMTDAAIAPPAGTGAGATLPVDPGDCVQMMWSEGTVVRHAHISDAAPKTAALAAMAATLVAERPGEKFAIVHHTQSGTDPRGLVNDADTSRLWSTDAALHAFATADGQKVGLAAMSWFAAPGNLGDAYGAAMLPLLSGRKLDGTPISFPAEVTYSGSSSFHADHWFGELYDYAHTRWLAYGPHRFDIGEDANAPASAANDMLNATQRADLSVNTNLSNKEKVRKSWRAMLASPGAAGIFGPLGIEPMSYQNGKPYLSGSSWQDWPHPRADSVDGLPMLARLTAQALLHGAGLVRWAVPEFDACAWQNDGSYAEVWSSAGAVTTPRIRRGAPALGSGQAHWTDVLGWQVDGEPVRRAEIVGGRVRIYPNAGVFTDQSVLTFGEGGGTGMLAFPEDFYADTHLNLPVVDRGAFGIDGIAVRPLPAASALVSTVPPVPGVSYFTTGATGPYFTDPAALGANNGQLTVRILALLIAPASTSVLANLSGNSFFRLETMAAGTLRLRLRDSANTVLVDGVTGGNIPFGAQCDITVSVDLVARYARVWLNGALVIDTTFAANTGQFPTTSRVLSALATNSGQFQTEATVARIAFWRLASPGGTEPAAPPYKQITGPAAQANADPWKLGANAT